MASALAQRFSADWAVEAHLVAADWFIEFMGVTGVRRGVKLI